jgi:DNA-binding response OmpR family regulator
MSLQEAMVAGIAGRRVLVAEDDPFIAAELHDLLAEEGAEILGPVPTVRAAMAAIEAGKPDAAVLDANLRDASSAPVADALRAASVPVVLVTGYARHMIDDPCLRDAPILSKPVRTDELLAVLGRLLSSERQLPRA